MYICVGNVQSQTQVTLGLHESLSTLFGNARTANKEQSITRTHTRCVYKNTRRITQCMPMPDRMCWVSSACKDEVVVGSHQGWYINDTHECQQGRISSYRVFTCWSAF
jgi:hypothetical protein